MHRFFKLFRMNRALRQPAAPSALAWGPKDLANDGVMRLNEQGQIIEANARALELLRCPPSVRGGLDFWEAVPGDIAEQHQSATVNALTTSVQHAFVAHHRFEGSWIRYAFRKIRRGDRKSVV